MTFEVGDIAQWAHHPLDKTLIGTLVEITEAFPPGDIVAYLYTSNLTEAWYEVIDVRGGERGARGSWLRQPPPVEINEREVLEGADASA